MAPPQVQWEMNINTFLTLAGFALTFVLGYGAYKSFEAQTTQQITEIRSQRASDILRLETRANALELSVNSLNIQDARQIEQIGAILVYLQRIERTLDSFVKTERNKP